LIPFGGGVRRCLAASYAQLLMKQVISTVIAEIYLKAVDPRSERPQKSAIAFVPHKHAQVISRAAPKPPGSRRETWQPQRHESTSHIALRHPPDCKNEGANL
jgi:hypothetical protein